MLPHSAVLDSSSLVHSERVALADDGKTNVHVFSQELRDTVVSVANLGSAQRVTDVCTASGGRVVAAMSGGFFAREAGKPLGELWIGGQRQPHVPFQGPWHNVRGSLHVDADGITIDRRDVLPARPDGDLLQAGPAAGDRRPGGRRPRHRRRRLQRGLRPVRQRHHRRPLPARRDRVRRHLRLRASSSTAGRTPTSA